MNLKALISVAMRCIQYCETMGEFLANTVRELHASQDSSEIYALLIEYHPDLNLTAAQIQKRLQSPARDQLIRQIQSLKSLTVTELLEQIQFIRLLAQKFGNLIESVEVCDSDEKYIEVQKTVDKTYVHINFQRRLWLAKSDRKKIDQLGLVLFDHSSLSDFSGSINGLLREFASGIAKIIVRDVCVVEIQNGRFESSLNLDNGHAIVRNLRAKLDAENTSIKMLGREIVPMIKQIESICNESCPSIIQDIEDILKSSLRWVRKAAESLNLSQQCEESAYCVKGVRNAALLGYYIDSIYASKDTAENELRDATTVKKALTIYHDILRKLLMDLKTLKDDLDSTAAMEQLRLAKQREAKLKADKESLERETLARQEAEKQLTLQKNAEIRAQKEQRAQRAAEQKKNDALQRQAILNRAAELEKNGAKLLQNAVLSIHLDKPLTVDQKLMFDALLKESCNARFTYDDLANFVRGLGVKVIEGTGSSHKNLEYRTLSAGVWKPHGRLDNKVPQACVNLFVDALFKIRIIRGDKEFARGNKKQLTILEAATDARQPAVKRGAKLGAD